MMRENETRPAPHHAISGLIFTVCTIGIPSTINYTGILLGLAYISLMPLASTTNNTFNNITVATTNKTNQTMIPSQINSNNPLDQAGHIALITTSITFSGYVFFSLLHRSLSKPNRDIFKKTLQNNFYFAIGINIGINAFLTPLSAFLFFHTEIIPALLLGLAGLLGTSTITAGAAITVMLGLFVEQCLTEKKEEQIDEIKTPSQTRPVNVSPRPSLSNTSFSSEQFVPLEQRSSGSFTSQSASQPLNPLNSPRTSTHLNESSLSRARVASISSIGGIQPLENLRSPTGTRLNPAVSIIDSRNNSHPHSHPGHRREESESTVVYHSPTPPPSP